MPQKDFFPKINHFPAFYIKFPLRFCQIVRNSPHRKSILCVSRESTAADYTIGHNIIEKYGRRICTFRFYHYLCHVVLQLNVFCFAARR